VFLEFGAASLDQSPAEKFHVKQFFASPHDAITWLEEADV
jgi:hypothetical protein